VIDQKITAIKSCLTPVDELTDDQKFALAAAAGVSLSIVPAESSGAGSFGFKMVTNPCIIRIENGKYVVCSKRPEKF